MPIFWNKNYFFIIVLQSYDVILNLNTKRCTKPPKKLSLMNLLADFCHYKLYRQECKISHLQLLSTTGALWDQIGNFPHTIGYQWVVENCRLTTLFCKIWLCNCKHFFYVYVKYQENNFQGQILRKISNKKSYLDTIVSEINDQNIKTEEKNCYLFYFCRKDTNLFFLQTLPDNMLLTSKNYFSLKMKYF